jgi:ABC-type uncharacterized transport system permease subunit
MDSCIAFLKIGFKDSFAYRSNVIMGIFGSVFFCNCSDGAMKICV